MQVTQSSRVQRLQRQHAVDLSAVTQSHSSNSAASPAGSDMRAEVVGFAAASALRSLKVPHTLEESSGVLVCDAEDLSTWAHRRHIELLTRLQQRRRRRKAEETHAFPSSDSEENDHNGQHGMLAKASRRDLSDDLNSGTLTPGLSGRGALAQGLQGGLNAHTSTLRASTLHAQHLLRPTPLPDSAACVFDQNASLAARPHTVNTMSSSDRTGSESAPKSLKKEGLGHIHDRPGAAEFIRNGDDTHENHAPDLEERHVSGSSGEW